MTSTYTPILFATVAMTCYAVWALSAKIATRTLSAEIAATTTYFSAGVLALGYAMANGRTLMPPERGFGAALLAGLFLGAGTIGYYMALRVGTVSVVTAISGLYIVLTTVLAVIFLNESLEWYNLLGVGFATVAIVLLSY
ncbi:EamA family transporter [Halorussus salinisoli]|uniref:EamA family transporter n=1 Tax=Halorussus salinisoli TaxID=2558242 RepID=UPI0010C1AF9D|nr:EamA family transporter [Halorussus salinisoli]